MPAAQVRKSVAGSEKPAGLVIFLDGPDKVQRCGC